MYNLLREVTLMAEAVLGKASSRDENFIYALGCNK